MSIAADSWVDISDPFGRDDFQAGIAALAASVREDWQRWAEQAVGIARLAGQVPGERGHTRDATAWKSFVREVAVARRCSDQAAAKEIYLSVALVRSHPCVLALLQAGRLPAYNARVLLEESAVCDDEIMTAIDAELAERACQLTPSRIRDEVRKIELRFAADAVAARAAKAATARSVQIVAQRDDQSTLVITGPTLPVARFYDSITAAARAARAAGDERGLDALRFDIALDCGDPAAVDAPPSGGVDATTCSAVDVTVPAWLGDRRRLRPVQVLLHLPVTTALGLDNEPGWLPGYGWISAPQCRQWLTSAELRQVCVDRSGFVVDTADRVARPDPTPSGVRNAILAMVAEPGGITDKTWRTEPRHDPSPALSQFIDIRDVFCDGPTGTRVPAARCEADHDEPYPAGPTAAWNLKSRATRTHLLKHNGWTPLRTATSTLWFSPAGQLVEVPHHTGPPPDPGPDAELPDPDDLNAFEAELVRPSGPDDHAPWDEPPPF